MQADREALSAAEQARQTHYVVSTSEDRAVSNGDSPVYRASRVLFISTIRAAFPDLDPLAVYGVWLDCNESVAYCARLVAADAEYGDRYGTRVSAIEQQMLDLAWEMTGR